MDRATAKEIVARHLAKLAGIENHNDVSWITAHQVRVTGVTLNLEVTDAGSVIVGSQRRNRRRKESRRYSIPPKGIRFPRAMFLDITQLYENNKSKAAQKAIEEQWKAHNEEIRIALSSKHFLKNSYNDPIKLYPNQDKKNVVRLRVDAAFQVTPENQAELLQFLTDVGGSVRLDFTADLDETIAEDRIVRAKKLLKVQ